MRKARSDLTEVLFADRFKQACPYSITFLSFRGYDIDAIGLSKMGLLPFG